MTEAILTLPLKMDVISALAWATHIDLDAMDAELLLLHTLNKLSSGRAWLRAHSSETLTEEDLQVFQRLCKHRSAGMPLAYLTGTKEFHGLPLSVDARVLDPRPDTETLVDWALALLPEEQPFTVADLGTGSGAIALALAHQRPQAQIWAVDACADALAVARHNARQLHLPVQFCQGHWLKPLVEKQLQVDLLVSNPPYIAEHDPHLPALQHEPRKALVSGIDGLDDIRHIVQRAPAVLKPGAWLLLEHGHDQSDAVAHLLRAAGYTHVQHRNDLAGIARCTGGQWTGQFNVG